MKTVLFFLGLMMTMNCFAENIGKNSDSESLQEEVKKLRARVETLEHEAAGSRPTTTYTCTLQDTSFKVKYTASAATATDAERRVRDQCKAATFPASCNGPAKCDQ